MVNCIKINSAVKLDESDAKVTMLRSILMSEGSSLGLVKISSNFED